MQILHFIYLCYAHSMYQWQRKPTLQHLVILDGKVFASVYILELVEQYILLHFVKYFYFVCVFLLCFCINIFFTYSHYMLLTATPHPQFFPNIHEPSSLIRWGTTISGHLFFYQSQLTLSCGKALRVLEMDAFCLAFFLLQFTGFEKFIQNCPWTWYFIQMVHKKYWFC